MKEMQMTTMKELPAEAIQGDWKLWAVQEDTEVIVARSAEEARAYVEWQTDQKITLEQVEEATWDYGAVNDDGSATSMRTEFELCKARGFTEPFQFWTQYP
jgi:hypothetical protein